MRKKKFSLLTRLLVGQRGQSMVSYAIITAAILGGLVTIINFDVLQRHILHAFPASGAVKVKKGVVMVKFFLRLLILGVVIFFLIGSGWVNPIGLAVGLSTVVFSIISFGIYSALKSETGEAT